MGKKTVTAASTSPRESMVFYREWREAVQKLSPEQRSMVYEAIFDYVFDGVEPQDAITVAVTATWFKRIDKDIEQLEARVEANRENGRKGGAPKGNQNAKNKRKQPKTTHGLNSVELNNPKQPKTTHGLNSDTPKYNNSREYNRICK